MDRIDGALPSAVATWIVLEPAGLIRVRTGDTGTVKQELVFQAPRRVSHRAISPIRRGRPQGRGDRVGVAGLPGQAAGPAVLRASAGRPRQMTDLPAAVREAVSQALFPPLLSVVREIECDGGDTRKTLWRGHDGATFESVLMRYPDRVTVCISSQAGCGMACPFCATGQGGLTRNLSTAEILEQVRAAAVSTRDVHGERLSNVVFMGMGSRWPTIRGVVAAVGRITAAPPDGFGIRRDR